MCKALMLKINYAEKKLKPFVNSLYQLGFCLSFSVQTSGFVEQLASIANESSTVKQQSFQVSIIRGRNASG